MGKNMIYETKAIYRIEYELILFVKELREKKGISQRDLSIKMGFVETFVGKCESIDQPEKYNLRHLGILKNVFKLNSLDDFFPNGIPKNEQIIIKYRKDHLLKMDGTISKVTENKIVDIITVLGKTKAQNNKK